MEPCLSPADRIKQKAREIGFSDVRVGPPSDFTAHLQDWISLGYHGEMAWMERDPQVRGNPKNLWPDVKSVIALGLNYGPDHHPGVPHCHPRPPYCHPREGGDPVHKKDSLHTRADISNYQAPAFAGVTPSLDTGYISVYARGDDYHDIVKKKLKDLGGWMAREFGCELKVFVDTAPVMEKPLAHAAGLGFMGKHTNLVSRTFGSWLFLGIIYTNMDLPFDAPEQNHCGTCTACLDTCPTRAFPRPYQLDARRCISYLTIEHKGPIPHEFREAMGNRIYGCDDCLAACPWNKFAIQTAEMAFAPRAELVGPKLETLARLDDTAFRALFRKSPIKRIGRDQFVRNVLIAIGNSGDQSLLPTAQDLTTDANDIVRDAALWAVERLSILN